jgi:hypothetical protein
VDRWRSQSHSPKAASGERHRVRSAWLHGAHPTSPSTQTAQINKSHSGNCLRLKKTAERYLLSTYQEMTHARNAKMRMRNVSWRMTNWYYPLWKQSQSAFAQYMLLEMLDVFSQCATAERSVAPITSSSSRLHTARNTLHRVRYAHFRAGHQVVWGLYAKRTITCKESQTIESATLYTS